MELVILHLISGLKIEASHIGEILVAKGIITCI